MIHISDEQIEALNISPITCLDWIRNAFEIKSRCQLPAKISVHPTGNDFITTMPCLLPEEYHTFGVKVVSRAIGRVPALKSKLMLLDSINGELIALLDTDWITSMRTGAVAAIAINTLRKSDSTVYSFMGLGNTARATMKCLNAILDGESFTVRVLKYKDQAERFIADFSCCSNVKFEIADSINELLNDADVLVSCISVADSQIVEDDSLFKPGVLVVPIHTRGFQNCDLFFDKVFADDMEHVKGFKYFTRFRKFGEIGDVLSGKIKGRESDDERILSYNIGLGLHDVYFSWQIFNMLFER